MGISRKNWFSLVKKKFVKSQSEITILHSPRTSHEAINRTRLQDQDTYSDEDDTGLQSPDSKTQLVPLAKEFSKEDMAAVKIQAVFRGHLARRAIKALRSLVKLQALVRGVSVRRQSRIAMHCMHALVRLQVRIRARQILDRV